MQLSLFLVAGVSVCQAAFLSQFNDVTHRSAVAVGWDPVENVTAPFALHARMVNKTEGGLLNAVMMRISADINGTVWTWADVPSPLPWLPTAQYQLELRPFTWNGSDQPDSSKAPLYTRSSFFSIAPQNNTLEPPPSDGRDHGNGNKSAPEPQNRTLGIALGLAFGIPAIIGTCFLIHVWRKRQLKLAEEKRWQRRYDFVID